MILPDVLTTVRLDLRKPEPEDAASLYSLCFSNPDVMRFLAWKRHHGPDETRTLLEALRDRWDRATQAHWVITVRGDGRAVGIVSVRLEARANMSYLLAQEQWGKGLMTEAAGSVCTWALDQPGIEQLWAFCETGNHSSIKVLSKIGFEQDGMLPHYAVFPNINPEPRDCLLFSRGRS